ncbi:hypothetical protein CU097_012962 [Rhizopus azygosporus]|uniref:Leucine-rich repeat-containing protein 58 n=1 Tax=Rhizopus azygosporus TaxID=86630 RepID=A0A367JQE8_RHIAZ|nr:hypothetical protein CU097_012962 [Rhizopus azygosporus]CEI92206.1 hypothetical protein RMCBS344292_06474 [Rhizopus microsporus]
MNTLLPMHCLFSPTTLEKDLSYVDNTYYQTADENNNNSKEKSHLDKVDLIHQNDILVRYTQSSLDLHNMNLSMIPIHIPLFRKLTKLDLSFNKLKELPSSIEQLTNLKHLNLSHNELTQLPSTLYQLTQLMHCDFSFNPLQSISPHFSRLLNLSYLDLSHTNLQFIPAECLDLSLTTIRLDHCPYLLTDEFEYNIKFNPSSLFEICAREIIHPIMANVLKKKKVKKSISLLKTLPPHILQYLSSPNTCSSCGGPYFDTHLIRYRLIHRHDDTWIPVQYRLCSFHWLTEDQRVTDMFSFKPRLFLPKLKHSRLFELK